MLILILQKYGLILKEQIIKNISNYCGLDNKKQASIKLL
jgi:hypothetical protein